MGSGPVVWVGVQVGVQVQGAGSGRWRALPRGPGTRRPGAGAPRRRVRGGRGGTGRLGGGTLDVSYDDGAYRQRVGRTADRGAAGHGALTAPGDATHVSPRAAGVT
ncbi:hypothetical protein [Streptomyces sp. NPDC001508]|uniref:hypothetical protein n=1 Tax=Streptomyces sp. NPDC001508 TaxID=3154656 RepID=UPI00332E2104